MEIVQNYNEYPNIQGFIENTSVIGLNETIRSIKFSYSLFDYQTKDYNEQVEEQLSINKEVLNNFLENISVSFSCNSSLFFYLFLLEYNAKILGKQNILKRLVRFDRENIYTNVDAAIETRLNDLIIKYNDNTVNFFKDVDEEFSCGRILYSAPLGIKLSYSVQLTYKELKNIYKDNFYDLMSSECGVFKKLIEKLPYSKYITNIDNGTNTEKLGDLLQ